MIVECIAEHIGDGLRARAWLLGRGSRVIRESLFMRGFVLEITNPPAELVNSAQRISENSNGGSRSVWVTSVNGCRVMWR